MRKLLFLLIISQSICFLAASDLSQDAPLNSDKNLSPAILPIDKVTSGMPCFGLTVFKGTVPERFECEITGVMHSPGVFPLGYRTEVIVADLFGGPRDKNGNEILARANILSGMSGSPIFSLDGKILGSVAAAYMGSKAPQAWVTPIELTLNFKTLGLGLTNKFLADDSFMKDLFMKPKEERFLMPGEAFASCGVWGDEQDCYGGTVIMSDPRDPSIVYLLGHKASHLPNGVLAQPIFRAEVLGYNPNFFLSRKIMQPIGPPIGSLIFNGPFGQIAKLGVGSRSVTLNVMTHGIGIGDQPMVNKYFLAYGKNLNAALSSIIKGKLGLFDSFADAVLTARVSTKNYPSITQSGRIDFMSTLPALTAALAGDGFEPEISSIDMILSPFPRLETLEIKKVSAKLADPPKSEFSVEITVGNFGNEFRREVRQVIDKKYDGKTLYVARGEEIARSVLSQLDFFDSQTAQALNLISERDALYLFYRDKKIESGGGVLTIAFSMSLAANSAAGVDSENQTKKNQAVEEKTGAGIKEEASQSKDGWQKADREMESIVILAKIEPPDGAVVSKEASFTVEFPKEEKKPDKKKKFFGIF